MAMIESTLPASPAAVLDEAVRSRLKVPYALRRVPADAFAKRLPLADAWSPGDIVLARVESIGKNTNLELACGRRSALQPGDLIAVAFGNRYATRQFEGVARAEGDACDLLSMGGVCGRMLSRHEAVPDPTRLRLLGRAADGSGKPLRLADFAGAPPSGGGRLRVIAVCGSSMDAGKSHTARSVIRALRTAGHAVAGIKVTGTAAGTDTWGMLDAGARPALDFVDGGHPSTYLLDEEELLSLHRRLLDAASSAGATWAVVEIADGLLERETSALLKTRRFTSTVDAWIYATEDPLAAVGGLSLLDGCGIRPLAVSGLVGRSPLAKREVAEATGVPCLSGQELEGRFLELIVEQNIA